MKILYEGGCGEIVEKKSRFIATVRPVTTEQEAVAFIQEMKKKYWDATHNCTAFVVGEHNECQRCNDDGEPSGTAGRPMLEVLLGEEVHNVAVVVTRYFGGTLLGTGGLVRAYQKSVQEGLRCSVVLDKQQGIYITVRSDYTDFGKIQYIVNDMRLFVKDTIYTDNVEMKLIAPLETEGTFAKKVTEATGARADYETGDTIWYGIHNNQLILE